MEKYNNLINYLKDLESAAVAFSGGVDSTFLLYAAKEALGDKAMAVTICSNLITSDEIEDAENYCKEIGIKHLKVFVDEQNIDGFKENPVDRCYICKKHIFSYIKKIAEDEGIKFVVEGSNVDDIDDYRPGMKAIKELDIKSPLKETGFTKDEIRQISKSFGLKTWNMQSAACLASRFEYGEEITTEGLKMVEKSESVLKSIGFSQFRVRVHKNIARIEVPDSEFDKLLEHRLLICNKLKEYGFDYVTMDLKGYRMGSMNEVI